VGGRTKTHPGIQGSGRRGLHESSARDQAHAAAALSQGCVEAMKGAQPHQSGTLKRGPWPNRGLAPGRRLRMPNPDALSSEAPRITRLPLATFFRPSSQGPDSKRLCPICTTTTRPLAIGASTQLTRTKEAISGRRKAPANDIFESSPRSPWWLVQNYLSLQYTRGPASYESHFEGPGCLIWGCKSKES
jgi:hypothetical protein